MALASYALHIMKPIHKIGPNAFHASIVRSSQKDVTIVETPYCQEMREKSNVPASPATWHLN